MLKEKRYFQVVIFLIINFIILNFFMSYIYRNYISEYNKFLRVPKNLKIINLGSSHGLYGIKYLDDKNTYNMALVSQNLYYDSKILKKYENNLSKEAVVVIPISIFSFYGSADLKDTDLNERYYNFLDFHEVINGNKKREFLVKSLYTFYDIRNFFKTIKYFFEILKNRKIIRKNQEWIKKQLTLEERKKDVIITSERHLKEKEVNYTYIIDILKICQNKGLVPILITTPYTDIYNKKIGEDNYYKRVYQNIKNIEKYFNFIYLDYSHDNRFINNLEFFRDTDHLNEKGAEYFTKILINDIEEKLNKKII